MISPFQHTLNSPRTESILFFLQYTVSRSTEFAGVRVIVFTIQVCNPYPRDLEENENFYSVMDVAGTAFPHVTESWYLIWMGIPLPMPFDDTFTRRTMPNILRNMIELPKGDA